MKTIKYIILSLFIITTLNSCTDNDNDELTGNADTGGLIDVHFPLISYVVASGAEYNASGSILQGKEKTSSVNVFKQLTYQVFLKDKDGKDSIVSRSTNRELLETIAINDVTEGQTANFNFSFNYSKLIENLKKADGTDVPTDDQELNIGDFWTLTYVSDVSTGVVHENAKTTKVALGTRYAGEYEVVESAYWNSGSYVADWTGGTRIIESVNASIYRHVGLAFWDDNEFYFTVDANTNVITILDVDLEGNGLLLNGSPVMTCEGSGGPFESIPCNNTTSLATPDDVDGKDQLEFTVGYFRGTGATREFFEKLIKK